MAKIHSGVKSSWPTGLQPPSAPITLRTSDFVRPGLSIGYAVAAFLRQHVTDWTPAANMSGRFETTLHPCVPGLPSGAERRATTPVPPI